MSPIALRDGSMVGLVSLTELRRVAPAQRATTTVGEIAVPLDDVTVAAPDEAVTDLLDRLASNHANRALVVDTGRLVGIVTSADLSRLIDVRRLVAPGAWPQPY